jgi:hypothetical protein
MAKIDLTENKAKQSPQGGVLVGKKDGQTIIYDDGKVGGWFVGKTHKEGGIQGIDKTSGQPIEVQTGEVIITAPALADQSKREFQGKMMTNREILSKINSDAGGVSFAEGGEIPEKMFCNGGQYSYGGKMMSDKDIVDEINKCGCEHEQNEYASGGHLSEGISLEDIAKMHNITLEELDKQVEIGMTDENIHAGNYIDHFNIVKDHLVESPTFYSDEQKAQKETKRVFSEDYQNKMATSTAKKEIRSHYTQLGDPFDDRKDSEHWVKYALPYDTQFDIEFKNGGEMKKNSLVKDAKDGNTPARDLNNYNDMLDVEADGQVGGDTGIYGDGGNVGKVLTPIVSNWNDVPSNWKDTKKVKKVIFANNPYDKGLYTIVTPFLGDDEYRPIMDGINFDKNGITCTDAHKLITLPYPNKDYDGVYNADLSKKKDSEQVKIDGKYPNYEAIIPESKNTIKYEVEVYKLLQYTNVALKYAHKYTFAVNFKIYDEVMSFNGKFLIEILTTFLKLGHDKVYAHFVGYTKAFVFSPAKDYILGNDELLLIMPVMVSGEKYLGAKDLDYNRELSVYYDFNDNEIHNADGNIVEFKMNYESNSALNPEDVKPFENMIKKSKNRIPILDYVIVELGVARSSNLDSEFELNEVNLPDGIYSAKNGTLEITMEAIEDYPTRPIFQVDEYTIEFSIPSSVLEYYIDKLKLVVGKDELRPVMMGICLHHTSDNKLFLASTDANILLKIDITQYVEMPMYNKDLKTIIQPNYLYDYLNAVEESSLTIKSNKVATKINSDKWSFYCRNIDGNFPNVDAIIPRESNKLISLDLSELRNCLNSDFAKKYESESNNKDGIFIFNHEHEVFIGTFDRYARENKKEKIEKLCNANISVKDDYYYYNDQSILLIMPVMTDDENVNFSFGKKILQRVISIVSDKKLEMHYSALNRAYLTPIHSFDYKKTTKEHKVKEQPAKLKEVKAKKENSEKAELLEAIETLSMLGDLEQDEQERKEIFEALEILNMIKKSSNYENGGMMKRNLSFTPIETPLN